MDVRGFSWEKRERKHEQKQKKKTKHTGAYGLTYWNFPVVAGYLTDKCSKEKSHLTDA